MLLFYSRNLNQALKLADYCKEKGLSLIAESMISFEAADFNWPEQKFDVVFFTSPRSVDFFLMKAEVHAHQKVACIGIKTKEHLEHLGLQVAFYGENSTEPDEVALVFKHWLGNHTVLFPISNQSNRSIPKVLPEGQFVEIIVYKTIEKPKDIRITPDILIFSSPSNARAYLKLNSISTHQKVACFGRTTHQFLNKHKIKATILSAPTEEAIVAYLETLFNN